VGAVYPAEWQCSADQETGRAVWQLTAGPANNYHLYFYNSSFTPDGRYLVFYSERTGLNNLFRLDLADGSIVQLTDSSAIRAEYWPFTPRMRGLGACLAALGDGGRKVYYFEGTRLFAVDLASLEQQLVLELPPDRRPSMLNADAAGRTLVFATWDEALFREYSHRAYAGEVFADQAFFQQTTSTIMRVDTGSGQAEEVLRCEQFWINHVLIHPTQPDLILFCHEWSGQPDRMWLLDTRGDRCAPVPGQPPDQWYEHEFWSPDGDRICFHGGWLDDPTRGFCGWCSPDGTRYALFEHSTPGRVYAHYYLHPGGQAMVTDGEARPGCISRVELGDGRQVFEVLCRHDTVEPVEDQRCHPHPQFTPDGRRVLFTSNRGGSSNLYLVAWNRE
jgi:oligogalacturonide lyase